jgi:peptidoglycan hydrolase CwlO-like protein
MKKYLGIVLVFSVLFLGSGVSTGLAAEDLKDAKALKNLTDLEQNRRMDELGRSIANLERKIDRLDDQINKLEHSLKELKRKV